MRILPTLLVVALGGCAQAVQTSLDRASHLDRVLEDVSAIIEGMAGAHTGRRIVLRGPEFRSSSPRVSE